MTLPDWCHRRPATTVVGSFSPETISGPGYRTVGGPSRQNADGSVKTTVDERKVLMGYPTDFELHGAKGSISLQLGNAVPPPLAQAILVELWGGES